MDDDTWMRATVSSRFFPSLSVSVSVCICEGTGVLFCRELSVSAQTCFCGEAHQMLPDTVKRGGLSHAHTYKYFFLVPKDDDDDDETLFDLNIFFYMGHKRTENRAPKTSKRLFTPFSDRSVSTNRHFRWPAPPAHDSHKF